MSILSDTWGKAADWLQKRLNKPDPHSAYIDYKILERAVSVMPNPMDIVEGHEETHHKWSEMSEWVRRTPSLDETDKKNIRLASENMSIISQAIKDQAPSPVIQVDKSVLTDLLNRVEMIRLAASFYGLKPNTPDPNITYPRPIEEVFAELTGIQPPTPDPSYPDRSGYLTHFYKSVVEDLFPKTAPSRNWDMISKP